MADYEGLTTTLEDGRQVRIIRPHPSENQGKEYWAEMLDRSRKWPVNDEQVFSWFPDETVFIEEPAPVSQTVNYAQVHEITTDLSDVAPAPPALTLDEAAAAIESAFSGEWEGWPEDFSPYVSKWYPVDHTHMYIFDDPHETKSSMKEEYKERNGDVEMVKGSELDTDYLVMPGL